MAGACVVHGGLQDSAIESEDEKCNEVLKAFLALSKDNAERFLSAAKESRPSVFQQNCEEPVKEDSTTVRDAARDDFARIMREPPLVQFSGAMYFVKEVEPELHADVLRIGDLSQRTEVHFTTEDSTAVAGKDFVHTSGVLIFEPGEDTKQINVPVMQRATWNTTTEFALKLSSEPAVKNALLGRYLWQARVKILDMDLFPSNRFSKEMQGNTLEKVNKWSLLYEYFKLNWSNPKVKIGTIKWMMLDSLYNLYSLLKFFTQVYLIDEVLTARSPQVPQTMLLVVATVDVVPYALLHFLDFRRTTWKVGGESRAMLQKALIRKFLNYSEAARETLGSRDLVMAITRDTAEVVQSGYVGVLRVLRNVGKLFAVLLFQMGAPLVFPQKGFNVNGIIVLAVLPVLLVIFLVIRSHRSMELMRKLDFVQDDLVAQTRRIIANYRLIADYNRRPFFVDRFTEKVKAFNAASVANSQLLLNNTSAARWLTILFIFAYTVIGGMTMLGEDLDTPLDEQELSLGMFLTNLGIISTVGNSAGGIYETVLEITSSFAALETIVILINAPIDLQARLELNRARCNEAKERRAEIRDKGVGQGLPIDTIPIALENLEYFYSGGLKEGCLRAPGEMTITQGHLTAIVGPRGEGKSTLLKILGGAILPKPGSFFLPAHLRVLHVSSEPLFFLGTLYENLVFGVAPGDSDANLERVLAILTRLCLPASLLEEVRQGNTGQKCAWGEVLSMSQKCLLCLARALIGNAEVLCVHRPTMPYDEPTSSLVLEQLSSFCREKGLCQDPETSHLRRPRTCIFTSTKMLGIRKADDILLVGKAGLRRIKQDEVTPDLLF